MKRTKKRDKYLYYENSVQSARIYVDWVVDLFRDLRGDYPIHLREDFCGTFLHCCEWVKRNRNNTAIGLDLDPEPLAYGLNKHWKRLKPEQRQRLSVFRQNALSVTVPPSDVVTACNFSFYILKERADLLTYFRSVLKSLKPKTGIFILEMAGGPGMIEKTRERRTITLPRTHEKYLYTWEQKGFEPIHHHAQYSIHFKFRDGTQMKDVFTYDWRLYSIPEVRDALKESGFRDVVVYWETEHRGEGTGEYTRSEKGDNAYSWIAYVVGLA